MSLVFLCCCVRVWDEYVGLYYEGSLDLHPFPYKKKSLLQDQPLRYVKVGEISIDYCQRLSYVVTHCWGGGKGLVSDGCSTSQPPFYSIMPPLYATNLALKNNINGT